MAYSQYMEQTWPPLAPGVTYPSAMYQYLEDGLAALSAQIVVVTAQVADLSARAPH